MKKLWFKEDSALWKAQLRRTRVGLNLGVIVLHAVFTEYLLWVCQETKCSGHSNKHSRTFVSPELTF